MIHVTFHHVVGEWLHRRLSQLEEEENLEITVVAPDDRDALYSALQHADVLWHVLSPIRAKDISMSPNLRVIQKFGVGVNTIDLDAAKQRGVAVCNMPGINSPAVAEMTLALMLSCLRRLTFLDQRTKQGVGWSVPADVFENSREIAGLTVGLVGYGSVPRILTPILSALGARVTYTATAPKESARAEWRSLDTLLSESDIISLHVPLTDQTASMIDKSALRRMKPGAVLINTSRGQVIQTGALLDSLQSGHLAAAGLDVHSTEPLGPHDPIARQDNVVLTPHVAWHTRGTLERSLALAAENCRRLRDRRSLAHRVI